MSEIDLGGHSFADGSSLYIKPLYVAGPYPLGVYVKELDDKFATHNSACGRKFHTILSPSSEVTYSSTEEIFLGNVYGIDSRSRMGAAAKTVQKMDLKKKRNIKFEALWGLTEQKFNAKDNKDCQVQHIKGEEKTIIGDQHPILDILNDSDFTEYGDNSYQMKTGDYNHGYDDLMTIIKGMQSHYPSKLTIYFCPAYTDQPYTYDEPKQWASAYGAYPRFHDRGRDIKDYHTEYAAVNYELVIVE